jgi:formate hydrogenlyase subunit 6/NADH:ubiquinone oxidoreductase subunit I
MTEMFRGMYVALEQYFRPPYTIYYPFEKVGTTLSDDRYLEMCWEVRK